MPLELNPDFWLPLRRSTTDLSCTSFWNSNGETEAEFETLTLMATSVHTRSCWALHESCRGCLGRGLLLLQGLGPARGGHGEGPGPLETGLGPVSSGAPQKLTRQPGPGACRARGKDHNPPLTMLWGRTTGSWLLTDWTFKFPVQGLAMWLGTRPAPRETARLDNPA